MGIHRRNELILRIGLNVLFFLSIFFFPWWVTVFFALCLLIISAGYEVVIGGVLMDIIYGAPIPLLYDFAFVFTAGSLILFTAAHILKRHLIFYT